MRNVFPTLRRPYTATNAGFSDVSQRVRMRRSRSLPIISITPLLSPELFLADIC